MTLLSAYHTPPVLQIRAAREELPFAPVWDTYGPIPISSSAAWFGERAGAAAGADLLRALYLLLQAVGGFFNVRVAEGRLNYQVGMWGPSGHTLIHVDFDHPDTLVPPAYFSIDPDATGDQVIARSDVPAFEHAPYALPYLWYAGQDSAVDHEEEHRQHETERTTRGFVHPVVWRRYVETTIEYDLVGVSRVLLSEQATVQEWPANPSLGEWSTFERWSRAASEREDGALSLRPWLYLPGDTWAESGASESLGVETRGPFQLRDSHYDRPLGRSEREDDAPERWRVIVEGEDAP
jgi:hypothetical protein